MFVEIWFNFKFPKSIFHTWDEKTEYKCRFQKFIAPGQHGDYTSIFTLRIVRGILWFGLKREAGWCISLRKSDIVFFCIKVWLMLKEARRLWKLLPIMPLKVSCCWWALVAVTEYTVTDYDKVIYLCDRMARFTLFSPLICYKYDEKNLVESSLCTCIPTLHLVCLQHPCN